MTLGTRLGALVVAVLGGLLLFAPDAFGYAGKSRSLQLVAGPLVAATGIVGSWAVTARVRWAAAAVGVMLVVTSAFADGPPVALAIGVAGGIAVALVALVAPMDVHTSFGGGWTTLLRSTPTTTDDPTGESASPQHPISASPQHPIPDQEVPSMARTNDSNGTEVVVVTGASAGLGRAIAHAFADHGARVALIARNEAALQKAADEVRQRGGEAMVIVADVADAGAIDDAASQVEEAWGPIDIWVNDAMVSVFSPVREMAADEYRRVTDVTYLGYVHGTLAALKRMLPRDRGSIVQVGSALAYRSIPLQSAYCAAKHAIIGFTDSLRTELIHDGSRVHVTVVNMPALNTPQFGLVRSRLPRQAQPVPPIFDPEVGAQAVYWAAHRRHREVQVGAPTMLALLGQKLVPGFMDRYMAHNAWDGQMTSEPARERPDNLFEPVPGDHGTHGAFDDRAHDWSPGLWVVEHLHLVGAAIAWVVVIASAGVGAMIARSLDKEGRQR